ncbi:MAG: hypothetical protein IJY99_02205 [Alphaproteobacteria bacterium]|nr:hypothetical protein [Alphaproteobacteria bacterium]
MTCDEFLSGIKSRGAIMTSPISSTQIQLTNATLQQRRFAMFPQFLTELYSRTGCINLGSGYIFGPIEVPRPSRYPVPSIVQVNDDISSLRKTVGMTVFGRNDLFWFSFDAFGNAYMLDNLTLKPLRKYEDPYRALMDCLIAGKI